MSSLVLVQDVLHILENVSFYQDAGSVVVQVDKSKMADVEECVLDDVEQVLLVVGANKMRTSSSGVVDDVVVKSDLVTLTQEQPQPEVVSVTVGREGCSSVKHGVPDGHQRAGAVVGHDHLSADVLDVTSVNKDVLHIDQIDGITSPDHVRVDVVVVS